LAAAEVKHRKTINQRIRESQDRLQRAYGDEANSIMAALNNISSGLSALSGDLNDQQTTVDALYAAAEPLSAALKRVSVLEQKCIDANIDEYDYTVYSVSDLEYDIEMMMKALEKKSQFIENQNVARNMTNLTPAQLEEFESTFKHFDRDDTNVLNDIEFKTAMESLGYFFSDEEFALLYDQLTRGNGYITFEIYIRFLVELTEDQTTPEQLLESFRVIAADKDYVTESDLRMSDLSAASIAYLVRVMPQSPSATNGFDYLAYLEQVFER
ncbi:alpha-actinin, partial [Linderina macrospora]